MTNTRFTVCAKTGYDFGHLIPRPLGVIGRFDTLAAAVQAQVAYNAQHRGANDGAVFDYAEIIDAEDEHALVGHGYYGDGSRVTSVRPLVALAASDDVLFRGSRQECEEAKRG